MAPGALIRFCCTQSAGQRSALGTKTTRRRTLWMCGKTPPPAMVARIRESNSSSPRMASCK
jgi:hypothetical protein